MRLSRASSYGILAALQIAQAQKEGPVPGRQVARRCGVAPEYLLKILQQLARVRVLASERGRGGGFTLAKPPSQTNLLEIVEAIDGPMQKELYFRSKIKISSASQKKLERVRSDVIEQARNKLRKTTIKQLMG